ncbi:OmpA family protein [Sediminicola luteus]|uniref:OmpA-like domain-containing protein n=1 Tax=Sediminicola luteus TaxID=319238 RepID=A0A2A4G725_9FLAO|nr:OmpA family protein [Sediminicola luteus]PCE63786.1 hypothetical protein B7P33_10970 [Sediminicola luteus]
MKIHSKLKKGMAMIMTLGLLLSCDAVKNANNTQKGAGIGAAGGAVIGGIIGNNVGSGNTALGAIIGAVVGGAAGGIIGNKMDRQAEMIETEIPGAEVTRVGEGINVVFGEESGVFFATNKSNISPEAGATLDKLVGVFKEYPQSNILIEGHTDSTGNDDYNLQLSKKRAQAVTDYLVGHGIAKSRFTTKGYGEAQPKGDNATEEGRAQNRRVEFAIVANDELKQQAQEEARKN